MIKLNLGCGIYIKKGWINVDKFVDIEKLKKHEGWYRDAIYEKGGEFVQADIGQMPFPDNYADVIEMNQVIEHFPMRQTVTYMKEVCRVLKPGGKLYASTPSFNGVITEWLNMVVNPPFNVEGFIDLAEVIYGNQLSEGESHRCPITPEFINFVLVSAGFKTGIISIARKGTPVEQVKWMKPLKKHAVFRNDNIILEVSK
jgi:SAM-dependent methyltransferase